MADAELTESEESTAPEAADGPDSVGEGPTVTVDGANLAIEVPADAADDEAAAIACAVGAHLHDQSVAAAAVAGGDGTSERVDEWKLAGRMKAVGRSRWPSDVREGEEWQAAARSFY